MRRAILAVLMALGVCDAAAARVMTATFAGLLSEGFDGTGDFGEPRDLAGQGFTMRWTYDTSLGLRDTNPPIDGVIGGAATGETDPVTSVVVTINGRSYDLASSGNTSFVSANSTTYFFDTRRTGRDGRYGYDIGIRNFVQGEFASGNLEQDRDEMPGLLYGYIDYNVYDYDLSRRIRSTNAVFRAGTFAVTGAVPEPTSWTLMVAGFGLVGGAVRRSRAVAA